MPQIEEPVRPGTLARFALFDAGFRPFFLFAGLYAAWAAIGWILVWQGHLEVNTALPQSLWHAHEMIYGFAAAALTGFLLTAVPNWTGTETIRGPRLALLFAVWLAGRVLAWTAGGSAPLLFAIVDLAFLPLLGAAVGPGILARNARRNGVFVVLIAVMTAANAAVHLQALDVPWASARWGLYLAIALLTLMITIVGGRIVPAFTIGGMRMAGHPIEILPAPRLDMAAIAAVALLAGADALMLPPTIGAALAGLAAALNLVRLVRWQPWRTWRVPLVWSLHLGYAWMVVGLALRAAAGINEAIPTAATHALTAGMAGTMILAVMSRASLGHTGRPLVADRWTVMAYALVSLGAIARTIGQFGSGQLQADIVGLSGIAWAAGFLVFALHYLPWLIAPRPDGRRG